VAITAPRDGSARAALLTHRPAPGGRHRAGDVLVEGHPVSACPRNERASSQAANRLVLQRLQPPGRPHGREKRSPLPARTRRVGARAARAAGLEALVRLNLTDRPDATPHELPAAARARVAVDGHRGQTRLADADEPTGGPRLVQRRRRDEAWGAACQAGVAGVIVTHGRPARSWAERVLYSSGREDRRLQTPRRRQGRIVLSSGRTRESTSSTGQTGRAPLGGRLLRAKSWRPAILVLAPHLAVAAATVDRATFN